VFLGKELSTQLVSMFAVKEMVNILGSLRRNLYYDFIFFFVGEFLQYAHKNDTIQKGQVIKKCFSKYFIAHNGLIICSFRNISIYQNLFICSIDKMYLKYLGSKIILS